MVTKREREWMLEESPEFFLNPDLKMAKEKAELKALKNQIISIIISDNDKPFLDLQSIENITSVNVLKILLEKIQSNETNI